MTGENNGYNAPLVYKVFSILDEVANAPSLLGISDLSRKLNISKSTVYGITRALTELDVLCQEQETKRFRLGSKLFHLGNQALGGMDLRAVARPLMEDLSKRFRETVFLGTFDGERITIIEKADSPAELKISAPIGTRIPIYAGAAGKVFLAGLSEHEVKKLLEEKPIRQFTENSITDPGKYLDELQNVRQLGFATDFEEYIRGVNAICIPLPNSGRWPDTALWMVGFSNSFTREKVSVAITAALQTTNQIGKILVG
ncbi:IclR family transcriptional regulator [Pelotomaculum isophthalicicum JI]|uniref:IclR family transcriptional regulator n=1 Tax=Pelotomaculum isophthalicicum JI TaxID=947010 RepID=A0A9X4JT44_9FIRM|nr:IclR family transcriptional regulator [Pelotomaculum isophthalicicum]MDF9406850.1 IclR family transcriptional regulator [Pelotomaculum isophthalicicum JI]